MKVVEQFKVKEESKGVKKVYAVENYEGIFKDAEGNLIDLRP